MLNKVSFDLSIAGHGSFGPRCGDHFGIVDWETFCKTLVRILIINCDVISVTCQLKICLYFVIKLSKFSLFVCFEFSHVEKAGNSNVNSSNPLNDLYNEVTCSIDLIVKNISSKYVYLDRVLLSVYNIE